MQATSEIMESIGLANGQASKKKSSKPKSAAQKLIPPKKGNGRRTAALEKSIAWIVAAVESFPAGEREEIPPVICLPCLDIKFEVKVEQAPVIPAPAPALTRPPAPAPPAPKFKETTIMGVTVTPLKQPSPPPAPKPPSPSVATPSPSQNGTVNHTPVPRSPEPTPTAQIQDAPDLDKDLVTWMKMAFIRYISLAGNRWPKSSRTFGLRMAQVACGFDVMATGTKKTKEIFPHFVGALFEMLDGAKSTQDLELLEYILKNSVYLDLLAEAAEFQTKNGAVSVNFTNYYEDKYLTFTVAADLIKGRK